MISSMTAGNLVDYVLSYNDFHNGDKDKKKSTIRKATQADFDNF